MRGRGTMLAAGLMAMGGAALAVPVAAQQDDPVIRQGAPAAGAGPSAPRAPSPKLDDSAGTTDANASAAAAAEAATRKIIADKEAYRASVDKTISDYDAKMDEYRRQVRENEARNAEIRRRNEARAALYKACVGGDKNACAQYKAGQ